MNENANALVKRIAGDLSKSDWPKRLAGNCIVASDIVQSMLYDQGIDSEIIECTLSINGVNDDGTPVFGFVGYDKIDGITKNPGSIDTHVVVITKTSPPMLIDFGISHLLTDGHTYVCRELNSLDPKIISEFDVGSSHLTYRIKERIRLPAIYKKSLLEKAQEHEHVSNKLHFFDRMLKIVIGITVVNFIANIAILLFNT